MTSPSRRNRPTTPRWSTPATEPSGRNRRTSLATLCTSAVLLSLAWIVPAEGNELGWRKPELPGAAPSTTDRDNHPSTAALDPLPVRPVVHESQATDEEGPRLIPATGSRAGFAGGGTPGRDERNFVAESPSLGRADTRPIEPRKLKSVLVRTSPSQSAVDAPPSGHPSPPRRLALSEINVLRAAAGSSHERGTASAKPLERDPFETAEWTSRIKAAHKGEASSLRLAQNVVEEPTRSVLVHDPFEDVATPSRIDDPRSSGQFVSQPMPLDGPDTAQPLPEREEDEFGLPFQRFGGETSDAYSQDRSLEAERARAEETCKQALDVLQRDTISTIDLSIHVDGEMGIDVPFECELDTGEYVPRNWSDVTFMWKASALCHKPLYFEDVQLERYGHSWGWHLQPLVSAAHFFTTVPILPYKMGLTPPNECIYALGYYRPGNCAPYLIEPLGTHPRAVVWQAGAIVGAAAIVP